jgi:hypothetical protein
MEGYGYEPRTILVSCFCYHDYTVYDYIGKGFLMGSLRYGFGRPPENIHAIVALFDDYCSAMHLTNTTNGWLIAEDGFEVTLDGLSIWIEAPPFNEWEPNFKGIRLEQYL